MRLLPSKCDRYGHVLIIKTESEEIDEETAMALANQHHVDIIIRSSPSTGELRVPATPQVLWRREGSERSQTTVVCHKESGILYSFDPLVVMFSRGNVNERSRFGSCVTAHNEVVVDMFAGIGYFSLPLATNRARKAKAKKDLYRPALLIAIEKNPESFHFLKENFDRYKSTACPHTLLHGDNRSVGDEYLGRCDRVHMGYLPDTKPFIPRALDFAAKERRSPNRPRAILHYHFLCDKKDDANDVVQSHFSEASASISFSVEEIRKIKSYSKHMYHAVADVHLH